MIITKHVVWIAGLVWLALGLNSAGAGDRFGPPLNTQLFLATGDDTTDYAAELIAAGADVNSRDNPTGMTPLMAADTAAMAKLLLDNGADPRIADGDGTTALHQALFAREATGIVTLLIAAGADVDAVAPGRSQETPFLAARDLFFEGRDPAIGADILNRLAAAGANVDAQDDFGYTVLTTAVVNQKPGLVRLMLALGADPAIAARDGWTPLRHARSMKLTEIAVMLEAAGATR